MKKRLNFWIEEFEFKMLEDYCKSVGRTKPKIRSRIDEKSYLIRKAVLEGRGFRPLFSVKTAAGEVVIGFRQ